MKVLVLYRDWGVFCGAFTNPESLTKCILGTLDQWYIKDINIALHPNHFRAYTNSKSVVFLVREVELDTGDISGVDKMSEVLPTLIPLFKERGWEVCDYRGEKT